MKRYQPQINLPDFGKEGQERLSKAHILVIGAGGLGNAVAPYLAAAGIGKLGIMDGDEVGMSNLHRQIHFTPKDVHKNKATVLAKVLTEQNPDIKIYSVNEFLSPGNALNLIRDVDVVVDATDTIEARYLINDACVTLNKPFVYAALFRHEFQLSVFNYQNGPTYRCLYENATSQNLSCSETGVLGTTAGIAGLMQANEVFKILLEKDSVLTGKVLVYNVWNHQTRQFKIKKNETIIIDKGQFQAIESMPTLVSIYTIDTEHSVLVDVREPDEQPSLPKEKVLSLPISEMNSAQEKLSQKTDYYFFCKSGNRSREAVSKLKKEGFSNVHVLKENADELLGYFNNESPLKIYDGAIPETAISDKIKQYKNLNSGAFDFFIGRVRADEHDGKVVTDLEFTAYEGMATKTAEKLMNDIKEEFQLHEVAIFHSLGIVPAGAICFVVFASSKHRKGLFQAVEILAKRFKSEVPIFGKELFQDQEYRWKINT